MGGIKKAGDLLSALFQDTFDPEALKQARVSAGLFDYWTAAINEAKIGSAADHSRIKEFERGVLVIETEHPGWTQLLQTKQERLLKNLKAQFPELDIQGISFCLSRAPRFSGASDNAEEIPLPLPEAPLEIGPVSKPAVIDNQALYESMERFRKIILARNRKNPVTE